LDLTSSFATVDPGGVPVDGLFDVGGCVAGLAGDNCFDVGVVGDEHKQRNLLLPTVRSGGSDAAPEFERLVRAHQKAPRPVRQR